MLPSLRRLRWQLTLSHLIAIAVTLIGMVAAVAVIAALLLARHRSGAFGPVDDARYVADAVGGMVQQQDITGLNASLPALAAGTRKPAADVYGGPPWMRRVTRGGVDVKNIAYIVVAGRDVAPIAGSDAQAMTVAPDAAGWGTIARAALSGVRTPSALQASGSGAVRVFGAYPVLDAQQQPIAAVVVAETEPPAASRGPSPWSVLAIFGAATITTLLGASLFAFAASALVAYLLSRGLVARIERLAGAAQALAAGDLTVHVEEGRDDELGALARQFNRMACDLRRLVGDLADERDRVQGVLENRRQLVVGISHELRTPIATVQGYLEAALRDRGALPQEVRTDLETMAGEVERLQRLVEDLFTLSRADVGRLELRIAPVDIGAVARRTVEAIAPLAWRQRRVEVVADLDPAAPRALADVDRADQIALNLIANAVRHTPPGGLVAVAVRGTPAAVHLVVRDTGAGIAADDLARVFERFYRGRGNGGADGVGLGLALVKELAEAMGGSVTASSTPGEGSSFTVCLPTTPH